MVCPRYIDTISKINIKIQDGYGEHERGYESIRGDGERGPK
jgi:hypothetical protein